MATFLQFAKWRKNSPSHILDEARRVFPIVFPNPVCFSLSLCCLPFIPMPAEAQRPLGTDVSGYQTSINWTSVKNAGVAFAWAKATEGTYYTSSYFAGQESGARNVGIYVGAYHYAAPSTDTNITGTSSADSEAQYFWNAAGNYIKYGGGYCVPMLDWEDPHATNGYVNSGGYTINGFTTAYMSRWVNEWCLAVSNHAAAAGVVGLRPVVYTGTWYSTAHSGAGQFPGLDSTVTNWLNWMSDYNGESAQTGDPVGYTTPWPSWSIWQYADTNWSGGDADVYDGSLSGFVQSYVIGGTNAPLLTVSPTNITVEAGSNVTFAVQASGLMPLAFQWYAAGHAIPGATSSNYLIASAQLTNAGGYSVSVSNTYANIFSGTAFLSVIGPRTNASGSVTAPANMLSWWPADGNGLDIYGGNNAAPNNGLYYTNGEIELSFGFDGSTGYLTPATTSELSPNWTLCTWVNRRNAPGASAALMGDATYAIKLEQYNGTRQIGLTHSTVVDYVFHCSLPQNTWTHLALVDSGATIQLYSNGVFVTSTLYSNNVAIVTPSGIPLPRGCIGGDLFGNGNFTDPMLGRLDDIQIYNRALSATEIANIYHAGSAGLVNAPEFTGVTSSNASQVSLQLRGLTGKNFDILTSTNLVSWKSISSVTNPSGVTTYTTSITNGQQFFRASQ